MSAQESFDKKEFGERLRRLRKIKGMTAARLGEEIDVAESTITNYERGYRLPNALQLAEIARILNVSVDYLISKNDQEVKNIKSLMDAKDINWNGYQLSEVEIEQVRGFLEYLIREKIDPGSR